MRNLLFKISYVGDNYHGFQIQKELPTIQGTIEAALFKLTKEICEIYGCGRTDAGVHAINYYFNVKTDSNVPCDKFPLVLNSVLPDDISVYMCQEVDEQFHSRFSAKKKTYRYKVLNSSIRDPFLEKRVWFFPRKINFKDMELAVNKIIGKKDFASFMSQGTCVSTTVRTVFSIEIIKKDNLVYFDITGDGFLYNMVRIIVGTLINVGVGKISVADIENIIESKKRENAGTTAPPHGLYLKEVFY